MAVQNSLAKSQKMDFSAYITQDAAKRIINKTLGGKSGVRFISSIVSAVQATPALQECGNQSILSGALLGESLKLSPSPQLGHYYLVPYNDKRKGMVAQFQIGYKGYIQLAIRSGQYKKLNVLAIKEGELEYFDPLNEEIKINLMIDKWDEREEAPTIGYYAMFELVNGFRKAIYWSKKQMIAHADKYSPAFSEKEAVVHTKYGDKKKVSFENYEAGNYPDQDAWMYSSFWYKNFDGMAYKTMLRQLISKWGIMSIDLQTAVDKDMAVIHENGSAEYVESEQEEENIVADQKLNEASEESHKSEPFQAADTAMLSQATDDQMGVEEAFFSQP